MSEKNLEVLELEPETSEDPFSSGKLFGVAVVGAVISLIAYYTYHQMEEEKREALRSTASTLVAQQIHRLTEVEDQD